MTVIDIDCYETLRVEEGLTMPEKRCVIGFLDNGELPGRPAVMKPREYIFRKKTFTPVDGHDLVYGWIVRETESAYLFSQEPPDGRQEPTQATDGTDWVPKNDVWIYQRTPGFEAPLPRRSRIDFLDED